MSWPPWREPITVRSTPRACSSPTAASSAQRTRGRAPPHTRPPPPPPLPGPAGRAQRPPPARRAPPGPLLPAPVPPPLLPRGLRERVEPHRSERGVPVGWAIAACLAAATATLRELG